MAIRFTEINSLVDFLNQNKNLYYFRGYKCEYQMVPNIWRTEGLIEHEFEMLQEITSSDEIKAFPNINCLQYLLEYVQHYGLKTMLLDWSIDPFIALYFSLWDDKEEYSCEHNYIACLQKQNSLTDLSNTEYDVKLNDIFDLRISNISNLPIKAITKSSWRQEYPDLAQFLKISERIYKGLIYISNDISFLTYHEDPYNENKSNQSGVFTLHKNSKIQIPENDILTLEMCFSKQQRVDIMSCLNSRGINSTTLFSNEEKYVKLNEKCKAVNNKYIGN